ncbi:MAG: 5'-3' exonuclease H3TH domain-containing protein, partial [Alphaproteobacteria bacterium]
MRYTIAMAETASTHGRGRVYLVDGSGYIFRAFHALPTMTRHDGTPVNAIYGFVQMILKLMDEAEGSPVAVIFDAEARTFRNDVYPEYKAHRPEAPEELVPQFPMFREVTRALNLPCIEVSGYEADDLIATYAKIAREQGLEVIIVSSDKDLMQLIRPGVWMYDPMRNRAIDAEAVVEKFGVAPEKVIDVQALAGDSIDNVPGVPGIGVKTAAQLINEYGDLETLLNRAGEIKQPKRRQNLIENAELARISRRLVVLKDDVPLEDGLESLEAGEFNLETLVPWLIEQCFDQILNRLRSRFNGEAKRTFDSILLRKLTALPTAVLTRYFTGYTIPGILKDEVLQNDPELAPDLRAFLDVLPREHGGEAVAKGEPARTHYDLVQHLASFEAWLEEARRTGVIAIHTEATGLSATASRLAGIALATEPGRACYVPLAHRSGAAQATLDLGDGGGDAPPQIATADALAGLKPLLEDGSVLKVGHDV